MTAYLCPLFQEPQFSDNDEFLAGGLLWFYEAGSSTLATAYTDELGTVAWSNPIVLDSRGESGGTIWLTAGTQYRIVLEDKPIYGQTHGAVITDHDNISGINDPSIFSSDTNWILFAGAPTYVSAASFSVAGDQRDTFADHRRVYTTNSGGTVYSSVVSATYSAGITTIVVTNDSGSLDSGLSAVYYSAVTPIALPNSYDELTVTDLTATDLTVTNVNAIAASHLLFGTVTESASGSIALDSGLLIQWGIVDTTAFGNVVLTLPTAYTTDIYCILATSSGGAGLYNATASKVSNTQIHVYSHDLDKVAVRADVYWLTIGK